MELRDLDVFVAVVRAGSFSTIARDRGVSKSVVSGSIRRLEEQLGLRLLNRTTRRLGLTEAGRAFHERCVAILAQLRDAKLEVAGLHGRPMGTLRVSASPLFGSRHIAPGLADFARLCPEVHVELSLTDRVVDLIEEGVDLAVRVALLGDSRLIYRRLAPNRMVLCAAPRYIEATGAPRTPRDLESHNVLRFSEGWPPLREWLLSLPPDERPSRIEGTLIADSSLALQEAALSGLGLVLLPTFVVGRDIAEGRLVWLLRDWSILRGDICAVFPHRESLPAKTRTFIDFLAKRIGKPPYWDERAITA